MSGPSPEMVERAQEFYHRADISVHRLAVELERVQRKGMEQGYKHGAEAMSKATEAIEQDLDRALSVLRDAPECWHYNNESREEFMDKYFRWHRKAIETITKK